MKVEMDVDIDIEELVKEMFRMYITGEIQEISDDSINTVIQICIKDAYDVPYCTVPASELKETKKLIIEYLTNIIKQLS